MEEEIIKKIKVELSEISKLSYDDRNFELSIKVDYILRNISELIKNSINTEQKQRFETIWNDLDYINNRKGREVMDAKLAYDEFRKKSTPNNRAVYSSRLRNAISTVETKLSYFINLKEPTS